MQIIAHRGLWTDRARQNSAASFREAWAAGFGIETDLRDASGEVVIAHDPPKGPAPLAGDLFADHARLGKGLPLALNIKADGLLPRLRPLLEEHAVAQYFLFDMSAAQQLQFSRAGLRVFTRHSDIEPAPILYPEAQGVWMDCFHTDWIGATDVRRHLDAGKQVCVVSSELHGRDPARQWDQLAPLKERPDLMLCTDLWNRAEAFFR